MYILPTLTFTYLSNSGSPQKPRDSHQRNGMTFLSSDSLLAFARHNEQAPVRYFTFVTPSFNISLTDFNYQIY